MCRGEDRLGRESRPATHMRAEVAGGRVGRQFEIPARPAGTRMRDERVDAGRAAGLRGIARDPRDIAVPIPDMGRRRSRIRGKAEHQRPARRVSHVREGRECHAGGVGKRPGLRCRNGKKDGREAAIGWCVHRSFSGQQRPARGGATKCQNLAADDDVDSLCHCAGRRRHSGCSDECAVEPFRRVAVLAPCLGKCGKPRAACGEILHAVIELPGVDAARRHATAESTALLEDRGCDSGLAQQTRGS